MKQFMISPAFFLFNSVLCSAMIASAQTFSVKKIKGNQALIEVSQGSLTPGQTYQLGSRGPRSLHEPNRSMFFGFEGLSATLGSYNTESSGSSTSRTTINLTSTFGWNMGRYELGPKINLTTSTSEGRNTNALGFGGFFDYNLTENKIGENAIYGFTADLTFTSTEAAGSKSTTTEYNLGGFLKWFLINDSMGIKTNLVYYMSEYKNDVSTLKTSGPVLKLGLFNYF